MRSPAPYRAACPNDGPHAPADRLEAIGVTRYNWDGPRRPFVDALTAWLRECGCTIHYRSADGCGFVASRWSAERSRQSPMFEACDNGGEMSGGIINRGLAAWYNIPTIAWDLARTVEDVAADLLTAVEALDGAQ